MFNRPAYRNSHSHALYLSLYFSFYWSAGIFPPTVPQTDEEHALTVILCPPL